MRVALPALGLLLIACGSAQVGSESSDGGLLDSSRPTVPVSPQRWMSGVSMTDQAIGSSASDASTGSPAQCDATQISCGGHCVIFQFDQMICGDCGTACAMGGICSHGQCIQTYFPNDSGPATTEGGATDSGAAAIDCGAGPAMVERAPGDISCGEGADGGELSCLLSSGEGVCCLGGREGVAYAPPMCAPDALGCTNGTSAIPIECSQISDCPTAGATACCLQGGPLLSHGDGCDQQPSVTGGSAVVCEGTTGGMPTSCLLGEVQICSSQADCPNGTTCTMAKWKTLQVGVCL